MALLGPDGNALSSSMFRKDPAPKTGSAYGDWAGRDNFYATLPGSPVLTFDLGRLTLSDYRAMRYNPQISASLAILSFMIHQVDWWIECKNKKIKEMIEDNLRQKWSQLVRAISQSYWAGFAPTAIEYFNNPQSKYIEIGRFKDLIPEDCEVRWKEVFGAPSVPSNPPAGMTPMGTTSDIKPKFLIYDGIIQNSAGGFSSGQQIPPENTFWYPLLLENGDYNGRKLLKSAFTPWYFSTLIHLFANRYFERFGEPTPIGRAPVDQTFDYGGGETKPSREAMFDILGNLRNRGVVVLPNDYDEETKQYEYQIEYLESQMRGADFERYLSRLDEEMSLAIFTPILLFRSGDVGSNNLGVQHAQCVAPETKILCADLVWRKAGDLQVGQEIVAFDEDADPAPGRARNARAFRTAVIEANVPGRKPSVTIETDIGDPITASIDHPFLVWERRKRKEHGTANKGVIWKDAGDLIEGDQIAYFGAPWETKDDFDGGWMSGIFDGEGCLSFNQANHRGSGRGIELCVVQNEGMVLDKMKQILTDDGHVVGVGDKVDAQRLRINGGLYGAMRCVGMYQPVRMIAKAPAIWEGRGVRRNQSFLLATVTAVTNIGKNPVASIQTSCGTFITEGYLSHNTFLWELNALAADLKEYIDAYVVDRLRRFNFGPNAEWAEWKWKPLGKENAETIRAMAQAVVNGGMAKPSLEELGKAVGMTFEEIKQTTQPPADPNADPNADPEVDPRAVRGRPEQRRQEARGVGEARATGRQVAARVKVQIDKAWKDAKFGNGFMPDLGFRRKMVESFRAEGFGDAEQRTAQLFDGMDSFLRDAIAIGVDSYGGPNDFMALFERRLDLELEAASRG